MTRATVRSVALELGVWETFVAGTTGRLGAPGAAALIERLGALPVKPSRATGLLGSYAHRGGEPVCIRLQLLQEPDLLRTTLLHELAHACEHQSAPRPQRHRCGHGPAWQGWALAFGITPQRSGRSPALQSLRQARLRPVAVCERCGCVFQRLRRLPARRSWVHPECGNGRVVPIPAKSGEHG
ncbi:MAG: hypothetical protein FDZ69_10700 [Deltaproteobacteria bacterium]|nr:MAG: hypothetical protein FDZ69_10700 [Deltaproteobacteria bacterium]